MRRPRSIDPFDWVMANSVVMTNGCRLWTGSFTSRRYASIRVNGTRPLMHRFVFERIHGRIPEGLCVCHRCDNTRCVEPTHLFLGSHQDNMTDRNTKKRHCRGSRSPVAKLTDQQIQEILSSINSNRFLAARYGVHRAHISRIRSGKRWRHASNRNAQISP